MLQGRPYRPQRPNKRSRADIKKAEDALVKADQEVIEKIETLGVAGAKSAGAMGMVSQEPFHTLPPVAMATLMAIANLNSATQVIGAIEALVDCSNALHGHGLTLSKGKPLKHRKIVVPKQRRSGRAATDVRDA